MHEWPPVSALRTGRNVPGPTCSVTKCARRRALQRLDQLGCEMQACGRRRHRALLARKNGLIVDAVLLVRRRREAI